MRQIVWPSGLSKIGHVEYVTFPLYYLPLTSSTARKLLAQLVPSVCRAITELHNIGYAHLDVRLANICFKIDGRAMLIDFDRSCPKDNPCKGLFIRYGMSVMYKAPDHWTVDVLDWRQLGIMICSLLDEQRSYALYHSHEPSVTAGYLKALLMDGENRESLLCEWLSSLHC